MKISIEINEFDRNFRLIIVTNEFVVVIPYLMKVTSIKNRISTGQHHENSYSIENCKSMIEIEYLTDRIYVTFRMLTDILNIRLVIHLVIIPKTFRCVFT